MPHPITCKAQFCHEPMTHVGGGLWRCPQGHERKLSYMQEMAEQGYLAVPIGWAPQSNAGDGDRCQLGGGIGKGRGSKSKSRRKKPKKGGKTYRDYEMWGA